jgi:hypothetical protein
VFLSEKQIEQSIRKLNDLNPFFGTVFLTFAREDLPKGETKNLNFLPVLD